MLDIEKIEPVRMPGRNIVVRTWPLQHHATSTSVATIFKYELTTPNMSQHVAPNNVASKCCDRLAGAQHISMALFLPLVDPLGLTAKQLWYRKVLNTAYN